MDYRTTWYLFKTFYNLRNNKFSVNLETISKSATISFNYTGYKATRYH